MDKESKTNTISLLEHIYMYICDMTCADNIYIATLLTRHCHSVEIGICLCFFNVKMDIAADP